MKASNRMALNTIVMYVRLAITMVVTLISSRWILLALGTEDFGIYNLVAGLLAMLMFLNMTMATASQRFMSYAQGKNDPMLIKDSFYYSCILHFIVGIVIVACIEIIGEIMLRTVLIVPKGKENLAFFCLHSLTISTFFTVISVPYRALLISHENIIFIAIVEIITAFLKLFGAIILLNYMGSRLKLYAVIMTAIPIITVFVYRLFCHAKYAETRFQLHKITDFTLFRSISSYAGWNLIGSISSLLRTQGVSMLLNSFYGVTMNAAYGIASQVKGQVDHFSQSIVTSTRPQIVKSEGMGNRKRMHDLCAITCKLTFLLLSMLCIPLIIEMPYVLRLWLKNVPDYAVDFTALILLNSMIFQFGIGVSMAIESVGKIKTLQIVVGGLHFIVLPIGYIMLRMGMMPSSIFVMICFEEVIGVFLRLYISKKITGLDICGFIKNAIIPSVAVAIILYISLHWLQQYIEEGFVRLAIMCIISGLFITFAGYKFALTQFEKKHVQALFNGVLNKFFLNK